MGLKKRNAESLLPPDLMPLEEVLTPIIIKDLVDKCSSRPLKILFLNPVETLDVYFMLHWFLEMGITNIHVDFYSTDPILLKNASEGVFRSQDVENYCLPQNLKLDQPWLQKRLNNQYAVDPRYLLKIQFHWSPNSHSVPTNGFHIVLSGPVFSDSYDRLPVLNLLPCYKVELISVD
jgi:hypothetical protein